MQDHKIVDLPDVTNRYDLLEVLKTDLAWTMFKAKDHVLKKVVVLTTPPKGKVPTREELDRLECYAKSLAKLQHPGIESILDYGNLNGVPYLVTDYMEGTPLSTYLSESGPLNLEQAFPLYLKICDIVEYIHNQKVAHNGLDLDCILVKSLGPNEFEVRLTGMENAQLIDEIDCSCREDISSLGQIFGQILCGDKADLELVLKRTFDGAKNDALIERRFGFGVMERIIERCWSDSEKDQFCSVFTLKKEISQAQARMLTWTQVPAHSLDNEKSGGKLSLFNREISSSVFKLSVYLATLVFLVCLASFWLFYFSR